MKDLNGVLERTLEKANNRKIYKINANNQKSKQQDVSHQIQVRQKELENAQKQIDSYNTEIDGLKSKIEQLSGVDKLMLLEQKLKESEDEKKGLTKKVKELEKQHKN